MTKVIRFLYVYRSLESLLSKRPIYIQIRALALAFQFARARGERQGMSERSDEIPPQKSIGPNSGPDSLQLHYCQVVAILCARAFIFIRIRYRIKVFGFSGKMYIFAKESKGIY